MTPLAPHADQAVRHSVDAYIDGRLLPTFEGDASFETRNSVYRVLDGVLFSAPDSSLLGAELVGWLIEYPSRSEVVATWKPGARAILVDTRNDGLKGPHIIVTSATRAFRTDRGVAPRPGSRPPSAPSLPSPVPSNSRVHTLSPQAAVAGSQLPQGGSLSNQGWRHATPFATQSLAAEHAASSGHHASPLGPSWSHEPHPALAALPPPALPIPRLRPPSVPPPALVTAPPVMSPALPPQSMPVMPPPPVMTMKPATMPPPPPPRIVPRAMAPALPPPPPQPAMASFTDAFVAQRIAAAMDGSVSFTEDAASSAPTLRREKASTSRLAMGTSHGARQSTSLPPPPASVPFLLSRSVGPSAPSGASRAYQPGMPLR